MASLNELINLSQYQSGDMGRERLSTIPRETPQEQQGKLLKLQALAAEVARRQEEAAIAKRQRDLWDRVGTVQGRDKTTSGVTTAVVDDEEAGGRDINTVGDYEAEISPSGRMRLTSPKKDKEYDRSKVFDRAKKLAEQDFISRGVKLSTVRASELSDNIKKFIPESQKYLYPNTKFEDNIVEDVEQPVENIEQPIEERPKQNAIVPQAVGAFDPRRLSKNFAYFGETSKEKAGKKQDSYGFHVGQIVPSSKGRVKYIGNNKWQKVD